LQGGTLGLPLSSSNNIFIFCHVITCGGRMGGLVRTKHVCTVIYPFLPWYIRVGLAIYIDARAHACVSGYTR
jgi:hypothetical protein